MCWCMWEYDEICDDDYEQDDVFDNCYQYLYVVGEFDVFDDYCVYNCELCCSDQCYVVYVVYYGLIKDEQCGICCWNYC